ncbi:Peptidylprolyl isomerase [Fasciola gigantica]|uniref:peptidylprolyl isomerase n=1 Tax=Fasciola gigantica TaxID=46835 RepID=A0A504YWR6_FASGI|nr:Peptidylprolyl isomerase [Fasciola gigantica]
MDTLECEVTRETYLEGFTDLSEAQDRGILKKVIKEGLSDLRPCPGDTVFVHYVGTYFGGDQHGVQFDSSRDRNERFKFQIGKSEVIKAWDVCVATMRVGEICELIAAPDYAYSDGKTLRFEIELFDTEGMDVTPEGCGKVRKSVLEKGRDVFTPTVGLPAEVSFREWGSGEEFRNVSYVVGDPEEQAVPSCIDLAIRKMNTAERSLVRSRNDSSKGDAAVGCERYEVVLKSFEKVSWLFDEPIFQVKHLSSLTDFGKQMELADELKNKANNFLKVSKYNVAIELYKRLDDDLQYVGAVGVNQQKTLNDVTIAVQLNLALAYLKLGDAQGCTEKCKRVLERNASNEKALFRLGQACLLRKDHEDAAVYFKRVVAHNPNNSAAVNQLRICEEMIQKAKDKEKKMYRGVFERFKETGLGDTLDTSEPVNCTEGQT